MARRVLMKEVSGGRQRLDLRDGVKVALGKRGMTVEATRKIAQPHRHSSGNNNNNNIPRLSPSTKEG